MRDGAVLPKARGFPLQAASVTNNKITDQEQGACNGERSLPGPIGDRTAPDCVGYVLPSSWPGQQVQINLATRAKLLVSAVVTLRKEAPSAADRRTRRAHDRRV